MGRFTHAAILVRDQEPASWVDELFELCRAVPAWGDHPPGQTLASRLEEMLSRAGPALSFAAVADTSNGLAAYLHGEIEVYLTAPDAELRILGSGARLRWRVIDEPFDSLTMGPAGMQAATRVEVPLDLRAGVTPGGGLVLVPAEGDPTEKMPRPEASELPFVLVDLQSDVPDARVPLPVGSERQPAAQQSVRAPIVLGVRCKRGHFNRPDAHYCGICGIGMQGLTLDPVQGPRPTLGVLVLDDGSTYTLDGDYLLGREPELDKRVRGGRARPLVVTDAKREISRVHATVQLEQWDVKITDRSANGTYVLEPNAPSWVRLRPGQPFTMRSGTRVRLGARSLVFEALNRL